MQDNKLNSVKLNNLLILYIILLQILKKRFLQTINIFLRLSKLQIYFAMTGNLEFNGSCGYEFNSPFVALTVDKITNNDSTQSGQILVKFYNTQYSGQNGSSFGNSKLIASFTLSPLSGGYQYSNIKRNLRMNDEVTFPWLCITVSQKFQSGFQQSDIRRFTKRVKPVYIRADTPSSASSSRTRKNFRIRNAVATGAKVIGAVGTVASFIFPPAAVIGRAVGAIGSFVGNLLS